jgi:hypothetical protein
MCPQIPQAELPVFQELIRHRMISEEDFYRGFMVTCGYNINGLQKPPKDFHKAIKFLYPLDAEGVLAMNGGSNTDSKLTSSNTSKSKSNGQSKRASQNSGVRASLQHVQFNPNLDIIPDELTKQLPLEEYPSDEDIELPEVIDVRSVTNPD